MSNARPGLYDSLITEALSATIATLDRSLVPIKNELRAAEAPDRISLHIARLVARAIGTLDEKERAKRGLALARQLVAEIHKAVAQADVEPEQLIETGEVLQAITRRNPDGTPAAVAGPLIPLLDTTLLTNAPGEPRVGSQLVTEIESADAIAIVMAFIRYSGLRPLIEALQKHCAAGKALRVLTTIYTGSTEARALDALVELGATVRVSYDTTATRLHAKGWMFDRLSGFSTAYIGSSNLTHSAQQDGLEWNVRLSGARNPSVVEKLSAVFESYWSSPDFEPYVHAEFAARLQAQSTKAAPYR